MVLWRKLLWGGLVVVMALGGAFWQVAPEARAQVPTAVEVWYFPPDELGPALIEYRDAAGTVLASYALASDSVTEFLQGGGVLTTSDSAEFIGVFDPRVGLLRYFSVYDKPQDTDAEFYVLSRAVPAPNGDFVYAISRMSTQFDAPSYNIIYYADASYEQVRTIYSVESAEPWYRMEPFAWSDDGATVLLHNAPEGIGGYILFWTYVGVQARSLANMEQGVLLGDIDGFAGDLSMTALVARNDDYTVQGINVTTLATGATAFYPLPELGETVHAGGNAHFSPSGALLAYQVARENPLNEKLWTLVVDLQSGQTRVVAEQELTPEDWNLKYIAGWMGENMLALSNPWGGNSLLVNLETGTRTEAPGVFLGYAQGVSDVSGFAPPGMVPVQCDTSPVSRLQPAARGQVVAESVELHSWASYDSEVTAREPAGATFTVQHGPYCTPSTLWWDVLFDDGQRGYVIEGNAQGLYLAPLQ